MAWDHQRKIDLEENLKEDYKLLKQYEDELRFAGDAKQKGNINKQIEEINSRINKQKQELLCLSNAQKEQDLLDNAILNITFKELDMVTHGILRMPIQVEENYHIIPVFTKISRNEITGVAQSRLMRGVVHARMVGKFVENMVNVIPDFPERLKAGFVEESQKLRAGGLSGNALLEALHEFSCNHSSDYDLREAGLAVLYYFFEKCEVFER